MSVELPPETVRSVVAHMNADHADAVLACVHAFTAHRNASAARMTSIGAHGFEADCTVVDATFPAVVRFEPPLGAASEIRPVLVAMTRAARARLLDVGTDEAP